MKSLGLSTLVLLAGSQLGSAQAAPPPAANTLSCLPPPPGSFGGPHSCIPIVPQSTTRGSILKPTINIPLPPKPSTNTSPTGSTTRGSILKPTVNIPLPPKPSTNAPTTQPTTRGSILKPTVNIPLPKPTTTAPICAPAAPGAFGGQQGCIPAPITTTIVTLIGTVTGSNGQRPTTLVTWSATKVPVTTTVSGRSDPTVIPAWICIGPLCNPQCKVSTGCQGNDNGGISGFPFPKPPINPPKPSDDDPVPLPLPIPVPVPVPVPVPGNPVPSPKPPNPPPPGANPTGPNPPPPGGNPTGPNPPPPGGNPTGPNPPPPGGNPTGPNPPPPGGNPTGPNPPPPGGNPTGPKPPPGGNPTPTGNPSPPAGQPTKPPPPPPPPGNSPKPTTTTGSCVKTAVSCTRVCTVTSTVSAGKATTVCPQNQECRRQVPGRQCTQTTGTVTTTSYTTVNPKPTLCAPDTCAKFGFCSARPSKRRSARDYEPVFSPRSPSRLQRRAGPTDPQSVKTVDLADPERFIGGATQWWKNAQTLVIRDGSQNYYTGDSSSVYYNYADAITPIFTGSGPSWGCSSLIVISDRGVWIGHFWEVNKMRDLPPGEFQRHVLQFIRKGGVNGFQGIEGFVGDSLFKGPKPGPANAPRVNEPLFLRAYIFTPQHRDPSTLRPGRGPGKGADLTDPLYYDATEDMKSELTKVIPSLTNQNKDQLVSVSTYKPDNNEDQILNLTPWQGLLTFRYVPKHMYKLPNGQCRIVRAVEVRNERNRIFYQPWTWPSPAAGANPDGAPFPCPPNIDDILREQGNPQSSPHTLLDPFGPGAAAPPAANPGGAGGGGGGPQPTARPTVQPSPSPKPPAPAPPPPPPSLTTTTRGPGPTYLCKEWQLNPTGPKIGKNCDGDPTKVVTVDLKRRATATVF